MGFQDSLKFIANREIRFACEREESIFVEVVVFSKTGLGGCFELFGGLERGNGGSGINEFFFGVGGSIFGINSDVNTINNDKKVSSKFSWRYGVLFPSEDFTTNGFIRGRFNVHCIAGTDGTIFPVFSLG